MRKRVFGNWVTGAILAAVTVSGGVIAGDELPFRAHSNLIITNEGFDPVQGIVYLRQVGTGHGTRLGSFTLEGNVEILIAENIARTTLVLTAANGDMLVLRGDDGHGTGPNTAAGTLTVAGGTGRFQGATGLLNTALTFSIAPPTTEPNPSTQEFEGTISFNQQ